MCTTRLGTSANKKTHRSVLSFLIVLLVHIVQVCKLSNMYKQACDTIRGSKRKINKKTSMKIEPEFACFFLAERYFFLLFSRLLWFVKSRKRAAADSRLYCEINFYISFVGRRAHTMCIAKMKKKL